LGIFYFQYIIGQIENFQKLKKPQIHLVMAFTSITTMDHGNIFLRNNQLVD